MIKPKTMFRALIAAAGLGGVIAFAAGSASAYTVDDYYYWRSIVIADAQAVTAEQHDIDVSDLMYSDDLMYCVSNGQLYGWDYTTVEECQEGYQTEWDSVKADEEAHLSDLQAQFDTDHAQYVIVANATGMPL